MHSIRVSKIQEAQLLPLILYVSLPTVAAHCDQDNEQLFSSLQYCQIHPLRQFLPPERNTLYGTRSRPHNYHLPQKLTSLDECNYMFRVLYKHCF